MDLKIVMLLCFITIALIHTCEAGKHKKVVIHVPYKVKKVKHTHTIYKTIHHHHHGHKKSHHHEPEEHQHFHHQGLFSNISPMYVRPEHHRGLGFKTS